VSFKLNNLRCYIEVKEEKGIVYMIYALY